MVQVLEKDKFEDDIDAGVVLVDFYADWCGPCRAVAPVMEKLSEGGLSVYKIDVDKNNEAASRYGVRNIPTVIVMADRKAVDLMVGAKTEADYLAAVEKAKEALASSKSDD